MGSEMCIRDSLGADRPDVVVHAVDVRLQMALVRRRIPAFWALLLWPMTVALVRLARRLARADLLAMHTLALLLRLTGLVVTRSRRCIVIIARLRLLLDSTPRRRARRLNLDRRERCVALDAHTKRRARSRNTTYNSLTFVSIAIQTMVVHLGALSTARRASQLNQPAV